MTREPNVAQRGLAPGILRPLVCVTFSPHHYPTRCGHCKQLAPIYEKVATELKKRVNVGKIDCTSQNKLAKRFSIQGFPTIF